MRDAPSTQEWMREFKEFVEADRVTPPPQLTETVFGRVRADLNPAVWAVFLKLVLIHAVIGNFTLLFCPQFGLSLFERGGLSGILMRFGERACMLGCGAVFMSGSLLAASLLLRPEEIRVIRRTEPLQVSVLILLSVGAFICLGSGVVGGLALFWALGSFVGGLGSFELGWAIRSRRFAAGSLRSP